jgi:two-component system, cell cycle response regulator
VKSFRNIDLAFRYGGEEFAVLAPEQNKKEAAVLAQRILNNIKSEQFDPDEGPGMQITVSIGIACYPQDADTKEGLIKKADQALYQAKALGKGQVCLTD